jgi:hypothetical protein
MPEQEQGMTMLRKMLTMGEDIQLTTKVIERVMIIHYIFKSLISFSYAITKKS